MNKIEFLIAGALAVSWHGFPRYSGDIDFLVRPSRENAACVLAFLYKFGFGGLGIEMDNLASVNRVIQLGVELEVSYIGRAALIRNKVAAGRAKDLADAEELRKRRS